MCTGFNVDILRLIHELLVEAGQLASVLLPIEILPREVAGAGREPLPQLVVPAQLQHRLYDAERVDLIKDPRFFTMTNKTADVCSREDDRTAHAEKFRQ